MDFVCICPISATYISILFLYHRKKCKQNLKNKAKR